MKDGLEFLYKLQLIDDQIANIQNNIEEIPKDIKNLENERDGKANIIEETKNKLQQNSKSREKLEKEILLIKEKIKKYREQMSKATTNKEYQGFTAEIKYEEDNIAAIEEKIIEKMLESDEIMSEIRQSEEEFKKISQEYNKKIKDLNQNLSYNKSKLADVQSSKESLRNKITEKLIRAYDNLFKKKNGKVVSFVETDFCGVCNVKIRPQVINELISTNDLLICENCGRILYTQLEVNKTAENQ